MQRILVIDDSPEDRLAIQTFLEQGQASAYLFHDAVNGADGIVAARTVTPDCILLDHHMPDMDGLEVLSHLLNPDGKAACAIIMMTGTQNEEVITAALKGGAQDYISKARLSPELLAQTVRSAIARFDLLAAQRKLEARYRAIVTYSGDAIISISPQGQVETWNEGAEDLFGWPAAEAIGQAMHDLVIPVDKRAEFDAALHRLRASDPVRFETEQHHRDGQRIATSTMLTPLFEQGTVSAVSVVIRDVSASRRFEQGLADMVDARTSELAAVNNELRRQIAERENVEASLRQSQKMEAVGQLTGGIAHDFNNMLQAISGNLDLMHLRIEQDRAAEANRCVESARRTVARAAALTSRLLAFARRHPLQSRSIDLDALIVGTEEIIRGACGPGISVELCLDDGLWPALCDPNQLENALLNVAINARDAMPGGGRLTVTTRHIRVQSLDVAGQDGVKPGDYVEIAIADTGTGMDEPTRARVFEPFFTTKPIGQGTGLGLSQLYGFARQSGGFVRLESELGQGTRVCVYLPRHWDAAKEVTCQADIKPGQATRPAVVLLVEDQSDVRETASEWLCELGYQVLEAADGPAALGMLAQAARVDLLVTDVGLPNGLNGRQVANAAREHHPDLPVLFVTGHASPGLIEELGSGMQVLGKPFTLPVLAARIGSMLNTHRIGAGQVHVAAHCGTA